MSVTEKRVEEGLNALREWEKHRGNPNPGDHVGRYFKVSNWNYHAAANEGNFDDLITSREFLERALKEGLDVPIYNYIDGVGRLPQQIACDKELVRLGLPLAYASAALQTEVEFASEILPREPHTIFEIDYDTRSNPKIAMAALDGFETWLANIQDPKEQQFQREWLGEHFPRQKDTAVILKLMSLTGDHCRQSLSQEGAQEAYEALIEKRAKVAGVGAPETDTQSWSDRIESADSFAMAR